jgi:hypothetical protein
MPLVPHFIYSLYAESGEPAPNLLEASFEGTFPDPDLSLPDSVLHGAIGVHAKAALRRPACDNFYPNNRDTTI